MQCRGVFASYTICVGCIPVSARMTLQTQHLLLWVQHSNIVLLSWWCFQQCITITCTFCRGQQCERLLALAAAGAVFKPCDSYLKIAEWLWIWSFEQGRAVECSKFLGFMSSNHIVSRWFCSYTGSFFPLNANTVAFLPSIYESIYVYECMLDRDCFFDFCASSLTILFR